MVVFDFKFSFVKVEIWKNKMKVFKNIFNKKTRNSILLLISGIVSFIISLIVISKLFKGLLIS